MPSARSTHNGPLRPRAAASRPPAAPKGPEP
jgi:hypothetical protein